MFEECISLETIGNISAVALAKSCYAYMFKGCEKLTKVGNISAVYVAFDPGYSTMFEECNALEEVGMISVTHMNGLYYKNMFTNSSIIKFGGILNKPTKYGMNEQSVSLPDNCYESMFEGCEKLTSCGYITL